MSSPLEASTSVDSTGPCCERLDALRAVAVAALRYMDEGGEHPDDDGLHIGSASDAAALNAALDELEQLDAEVGAACDLLPATGVET